MTTEYSKEQVIGLAVAFMFLSILFYALRVWARLLIGRFTLDDYLAGGALILSIICCALQLAAAVEGRLGTHQALLPDGTADMNDPGLAFFENSKFVMNMLSILGLGLVKCSILVLYLNLFPSTTFKWVTYGMLAYVGVWTVSFFFSHLFTCYPIDTFIDFFEHKNCVNQAAMFLTVLYTNVVADFAILVLPVPMIMGLQLQLKTKLAVIGMLSLGAATCAISVTRVIAITSVANEYVRHPNDIIYYTAPVFYWTNIELSMAVVCACLPTLRPIWFHFYPKKAVTGSNSYEFGYGASSSRKGTGRNNIRSAPYTEIDEMELGENGSAMGMGGSDGAYHNREQLPNGRSKEIVKQMVIAQTVDDAGDASSTTDLRPTEQGSWRGRYGRGI
ncbi:uncharacterized protein B0I36DRAFT_258309 [Microdochium trichocladiopsis]|uniref:Rhodopsin domain-containing protein n=1 Tax=Microdochium trichocladiopsis TaxID=1682393 RepID=A0A9P9BGX6_9PEZI|nr:uncharacterized protein B0I36DRAFT_258309 [Microdochium trichocladiopsis]KAH7007944.1 hypothetical protein B0I36DRAFT_258309 [Microdochium trichocladiopsis]